MMSKEGPSEGNLRIECKIFMVWARVVEQVERETRSEGYLGVITSQRGRVFRRHTPVNIPFPVLLIVTPVSSMALPSVFKHLRC